ncbi:HNH endonuclease [Flectobacillus sp. DC10W]|uniref:HNH endonuclease n=1 Tax=Flectobacillus longus TaxID=2984207 RepID=A0ABT6YLD0_9BACT|nr:HNH endonuclease [Flectobacillus longus]MDI9863981.1 HNH endonuclease [Flectobacillus longus]
MKEIKFIRNDNKLPPYLGLIMKIILEKYSSKITNIGIANEIVNEISNTSKGAVKTTVGSMEAYVSNFRKLMKSSDSNKLTTISVQGFSLMFYLILKEKTFSEFTNSLEFFRKCRGLNPNKIYGYTGEIVIGDEQNLYDFFSQIKSETLVSEGLKLFEEAFTQGVDNMISDRNDETKSFIYTIIKKERDTDAIKEIKRLRGQECQLCGKYILMSDGSKYVEAAHITPKSDNGVEKPSNILILCPNHHKEFDLGKREIIERNESFIRFKINGIEYKLDLN